MSFMLNLGNLLNRLDEDEDYQCIPSPEADRDIFTSEPDRTRPLTPAPSSAHAFWLVVQLPKERFSERLEWNDKISAWFPLTGAGVLGFFNKKTDYEKAADEDQSNVHLAYKCRLQNTGALLKLLKFMHKEEMLEKEV